MLASGAAVASSMFTGTVGAGPYKHGGFPFPVGGDRVHRADFRSATITLTNRLGPASAGMNFPAIAVNNAALYSGLASPPLVPVR